MEDFGEVAAVSRGWIKLGLNGKGRHNCTMNPRHNGLNEKDRSKEEDPNGKGKETGDDNLFNVWVKGGFHPEVHRGEKETYG